MKIIRGPAQYDNLIVTGSTFTTWNDVRTLSGVRTGVQDFVIIQKGSYGAYVI